MTAGRTSIPKAAVQVKKPFGFSGPHPVKLAGASMLLESDLPSTENLTKLHCRNPLLYNTHSRVRSRPVGHIMDGVLTGVGRTLARILPITSQITKASRNCPTRRDRLYRDHTLIVCSTGIYCQKLHVPRD
jgi:hypothetical protein